MITYVNGRPRSTRTPEEAQYLLREEIEALVPEEREALQALLSDAGLGVTDLQAPSLLSVMSEATFKRPLVDMETFIKDPYYLGTTCNTLYPQLLEDMTELFSGGYHEAILAGSIGWGKSFFGTIGICRLLYELSCMKDIHRSFGLAPGTNISVVVFSVSKELAKKVAFEGVATKLKESPYFQQNFPFQPYVDEIRFADNVWLAARATSDTSALGLNVIGGMIDEGNFMSNVPQSKNISTSKAPVSQADSLYSTLRRRMQSRFEKRGQLPGMLFVISSAKIQDDFTARRIREALHDPTVFVRDYSMWGPKPASSFKKERFWVLCGNDAIQSKILTPEEKAALPSPLPEDVVVVDVPEDFRFDFERDLEGAIRDIAGIATVAIMPYIQNRAKLLEAVDSQLRHPFSTQTFEMGSAARFLPELLVETVPVQTWSGSGHTTRPLLNPNAIRYIHIDPSLTRDRTGFCMSHVAGFVEVVRRNEAGALFKELAPMFVVDVILQIAPPTGGEIILGDIRRLVYELADMGFTIGGVTMDSFQSRDSIQQLTAQGFAASVLSVDLTPDPYEVVKTAFYENRIKLYDYAPLMKELRELEWITAKRKVDHPATGAKDCADALAGSLYTAAQHSLQQPLPILPGLRYTNDATWLSGRPQTPAANEAPAAQGRGAFPPFLSGVGGIDDDEGWHTVL